MANVFFDALDGGERVSGSTITYNYSNFYYAWTAHEKAQFTLALTQWSNVADIRFVQTGNAGSADFVLNNVDSAFLGAGTLGAFEFPGSGRQEGFFNYEGSGWDYNNTTGGLAKGGYGFVTILHEVGHGLGLAHPHDRDGGSGVFPGVSGPFDTGQHGYNQGLYSVMSYNDGRVSDNLDPDVTPGYGWTGTPMAFDIFAIQQIYGANNSYKTGNNVYRLPEANDVGTYYSAIWDAGGTDWIRYDGDDSSTIDLRAASLRSGDAYAGGRLSSADGIYGGYTIAKGVTIENANGGSARDHMYGNQSRNVMQGDGGDDHIIGLGGNDRLIGNSGNDYVRGGTGNDSLSGHGGNDKLFGDSGRDILSGDDGDDILNGGGDIDVLRGHSGNDRLIGGAADDRLYSGSGNDILIGGGGNDKMFAGGGNDTLNGGAGNDLFGFSGGVDKAIFTGNWGNDRVTNFTLGEDFLDFSKVAGLNTFKQLSITDAGRDAVISFRGESVTLVNINHKAIDEDDVIL